MEIDGKPFTDFYIGPETAKPYLHPLRTADGKIVTRGFPMVTDIPARPTTIRTIAASGSPTATSTATISGATKPTRRAPNKGKGRVVLERVDKFATGKKSGTVSATLRVEDP